MAIWFWILTSFAGFRGRDAGELFEAGGFDWQVKFQAVSWVALGLIALYLLIERRADIRLVRRGPLFWYSCFVGMALVSTLYSQIPMLTLFRAGQLAIALVLVISLREHLHHIYTFIVAYILLNWVLVMMATLGLHGNIEWIRGADGDYALFTDSAFSQWRFHSAFGHPSWISIFAAVGAIGLLSRTQGRQWRINGPLIALLLLTVYLAMSRTALVGLFGGLVVVAFGRRVLLPWLCAAGVAIPLLLMSGDINDAAGRYFIRGQTTQEFESLTGRVGVYAEAFRRIQSSWLTGQGFQAGRVNPLDESGENVALAHAHNLILESLNGMGILGAFFAAMVLFSLGYAVWKILRRDGFRRGTNASLGWELTAVLVPLYAYCALDSGFAVYPIHICLLFLVVMSIAQTHILNNKPPAVRAYGGLV